MNTSCVRRMSACSATVPANEFSMGITAAATDSRCKQSNTSAERVQGTTVQRGNICSAASWLKDPRSPWMATFITWQGSWCGRESANTWLGGHDLVTAKLAKKGREGR